MTESEMTFFETLSPEKDSINQLRTIILKNLPSGFIETINNEMIDYVVPHSIYPEGYHCNPQLPLPFISIASKKNFIVLYYMGIYAKPDLESWFVNEYPKHCNTKLDMGKSCIRFKKPENIPFDLIGKLATKLTSDEWIEIYESAFKKK